LALCCDRNYFTIEGPKASELSFKFSWQNIFLIAFRMHNLKTEQARNRNLEFVDESRTPRKHRSAKRNLVENIMDQHAFIAKVLAKTGWSQSDLAARAGLDPSTLSRFLSKGREGHALRASTIQRIATASGFAFDSEIVAEISGFSESEAKPFEFVAQDRRAVAIKLLCDQNDSSDAWILKSRALESLGHLPGDVLIVGLNTTPHIGDIVCAQIYDWAKGGAETVFRIYQPPALIAATHDTNLLKPFLLTDNAVVVKGVVLHSLRSR
jgi:transcriptional regulator with XRE-family HTH domain